MVRNIEPLYGSTIGPGYPLIVALNFLISGLDKFWFLIFVQCLMGTLTVLVVYKLAFKMSNNKIVAFLSGLWLSIYIQYIWYTPWVLKETLVFILFPCSIYLAIKIRDSLELASKETIFFILCFTYLIHSDERYIIFLPFILLFILVPFNYFKKRLLTLFVLLIGIIVFMLPWLYRNYLVYNRPVILTVRTTVLTDKFLGYEPLWSYEKSYNSLTKQYRIRTGSEKTIPIYKSIVDSLLSGKQIKSTEENIYGLNNIKEQVSKGNIPVPFNKVKRFWSYFKAFWQPCNFKGNFTGSGYRYEAPWNMRLNITSILQYGILLPFFIYGIYIIFKNKNQIGIFLFVIIFIHAFVHIFITWSNTRYRLPIDSFIIIIAFTGIFNLFEKIKTFSIKG